jgi:site-specific DNA-methyltransferase (adenine-specific)
VASSNGFFKALNIASNENGQLRKLSAITGIKSTALRLYNEKNILPSPKEMEKITEATQVTELELKLAMGILDRSLIQRIKDNAPAIASIVEETPFKQASKPSVPQIKFQSQLGRLYQGDCIDLMRNLEGESVDLVFADPPFNLNKLYPSQINDDLKESQYLDWCEKWLRECIRILKPGGSLLVWNIPKWNSFVSGYLHSHLSFRHWIAVDMKCSLPIQNKLYPSHYSLLYYVKGERPKTFHPDRLPMKICPKCHSDLKDYGGYKDKMNPKGVNITDVWDDISPVRHAKYKRRKLGNELPIKLLDRIIEMASDESDIIFDPFGGSGTTYAVAELKKRQWIGIEIGPVEDIINRLSSLEDDKLYLDRIRKDYNKLFTEKSEKHRKSKGI